MFDKLAGMFVKLGGRLIEFGDENKNLEGGPIKLGGNCEMQLCGPVNRVRPAYAGSRYLFLTVLFTVLLVTGCATSGGSSGRLDSLKGIVAQPVKGAYLFVYEKGADPHGPPFTMSEATGPDGSFDLELPDGEYTIVARKHASGLAGSPLSEGDLKSDTIDIKVVGGKIESQTLFLQAKDDKEQYFGAGDKSRTAISGLVHDSEGNPMKGFRVHVYTYAQMSERPKYVSAATGPDGKYIVYLPKGGTYYIAARDHFGGPPKIGDFYGRFDEGTIDPSGVIVKTGSELDNVNITVHKVW
ncbi:MAG TPA: hypothetical protein VGB23_08810 [Nitrospirota bacterium]